MGGDELTDLRRRRLEQLQRDYASQTDTKTTEEAQLQQQVEQLEGMVKQHMTKDALQRYGNIKLGHPERATQTLVILAQLMQTGRVSEINDTMLRDVLMRTSPPKKEFNIRK